MLCEICQRVSNYVHQYKDVIKDAQCVTVAASFLLSPKLGTYRLTFTPLASFFSSKSHLFRNKMIWVRASNLLEQIIFHNWKLSSRRLVFPSSASFWSKQLIGARKMIASQSSKKGNHAGRWRLLVSRLT